MLIKILVNVIQFKKVFIFNYLTKLFCLGDFCYSYYSVRLYNPNFKDSTFRFSCGGAYGKFYYNYLLNYNQKFKFIDVGANIGIYSLIAKKNKLCKKTISIEPVKSTFKSLKKNIVSKNNFVYNFAISNFNGYSFIFYDKIHSGAAKIFKSKNNFTVEVKEKIKVKNFRFFDKIFEKEKIKNYLVKIDVEGSQLIVVKELKKSKIYKYINSIYVETENNKKSINKLKNILYGFQCENIANVLLNKHKKNVNLMFVRKVKK